MSVCTFFGHSECHGLDMAVLRAAIENLIKQGADTFLVGNQGQFDGMVLSCLRSLWQQYGHIRYSVVLAYMPAGEKNGADMENTLYPEIEGHPRFAIERRNRYLIDNADMVLCYVDHTWGGAYKFAKMARSRGLTVVNIGKIPV